MLQSLSIRNVVLIDKLDLDFKSGLSVLTGETGAGKSILLDSLGLVLGNRAETSLIRQGEDKLSVTAQFSLQKQTPALRALLDEYEIEADDELLIKRSLTRDGQKIDLTQVEFQIMELFFRNPGVALVRERILKGVWGENYFGDVKIVDVNIRRLRMKVEDEPSHPAHILTVWGYGYRWEE